MGNRGKDTTQAIMDGIIKFVASGGFVTTALLVPNAVQIFEKPLNELLGTLDKRAQKREVHRVLAYMKQRGLIQYTARDYEHGITLTKAGKQQLKKRDYETIAIPKPDNWDKKWRLVFFDVPEELHSRRTTLTQKLRLMGFQQLQQSIWIHPFPCRAEIEAVSEIIDIRSFVTYVEISHIDNSKELLTRFKALLS